MAVEEEGIKREVKEIIFLTIPICQNTRNLAFNYPHANDLAESLRKRNAIDGGNQQRKRTQRDHDNDSADGDY